ncbi:MAG: type I restriction enzyme HsdR N-terminal domain-containing protein [Magnetococcales bacterium]|nr:type I restriction enzyme HsdR N-terminal domain-containing protein [Magnetococcales bacterium]
MAYTRGESGSVVVLHGSKAPGSFRLGSCQHWMLEGGRMMDFSEKIRILSERILETQKHIQTEEATKQAFVVPFISALGFDVHDPRELIPEYTADVGTRKGEKVDYAIMRGGQPIMLIECKIPGIPLDDKANLDQLIRYFGVTKARIAVLTNGILYRFFTDLDAPNLMDQKPFLAFSLLEMRDDVLVELLRFCKDRFDINQIVSAAAGLKYTDAIKSFLTEQSRSPSDRFVQFLAMHVCNEKPSARVVQHIRDATKRALASLSSGQIAEKPKSLAMVKDDQHESAQMSQTSTVKRAQTTPAKPQWDEESFLNALTETNGKEIASIAKRILEWIRDNMNGVGWGQGKYCTAMGIVLNGGRKFRPLHVNSLGFVYISFEQLSRWSLFSDIGKRRELLAKLNTIHGVALSAEQIEKWPSFPLSALQNERSLDQFFNIFKWVVDEIKRG